MERSSTLDVKQHTTTSDPKIRGVVVRAARPTYYAERDLRMSTQFALIAAPLIRKETQGQPQTPVFSPQSKRDGKAKKAFPQYNSQGM
eukprot:1158125-Pelagomonas_calceolata.AAC.6